MTALHAVTPAAARDETDAGEEEGEGQVQIVLLFGLGWWLNSTTHESHAMYLNDVHILSHVNATWAWRHLHVQGSPPKARASHSATLTPDGQRLLVFGGMDAAGPLADAHLLDLSHEPPIWWQLHPVGQAPSPRYAHSATLFGSDLLIIGGLPLGGATGVDVQMLSFVSLEMQTSAMLAPRLSTDHALNRSCSLLMGSKGSPVQQYTCGGQLTDS